MAAALIRLYREKLPPPEDVYDDERMKRQQESRRDDRGRPDVPFTDFARGGDMAWFRINIGREKNADPKWLMPMICRLGHVTKRDIGTIRIFDRDTKFEITREAEAKFKAAIAGGLEDGVTIETAVAPGPKEKPAPRWDKPPRANAGKPRPSRDNAEKSARKLREDRPEGAKKPWVKRDAPTAEAAATGGKKPWAKRTEADPTPPGKKPWVKKPYAGKAGVKSDWTPTSDASPAPSAGDKPWKGKPKGGDRPWAPKDARGKPQAAKPGKPFKRKTPRS